MKIARIVGARPQLMQVPSLRNKILERGYSHILVHSGQHYDYALSQGQCDDLELGVPDYNLGVGSGSPGATTGLMIERIESLLKELEPDIVVVDGDTNTTLATAVAVVKTPIPLVHVEAGLRDYERARPEEINRSLTDHSADLNCAPVRSAMEKLQKENLGARTVLTGDLLLDCLCMNEKRADESILKELDLVAGNFHVMTLHRPENTDIDKIERFSDIMAVASNLDHPVIWPVHPRARAILELYKTRGAKLGAVRTIEPLTYLRLLALVKNSDMVLTDSGGLPREAVWNGKRCVALYGSDLWPDLIENGWAQLACKDRASIERAVRNAIEPDASLARDYFGGGQAAERILDAIEEHFLDKSSRSVVCAKSSIGTSI